MSTKFFILSIITDKLPQAEILVRDLGIPSEIQLADPHFLTDQKLICSWELTFSETYWVF